MPLWFMDPEAKFAGLNIDLAGLGRVQLTHLLAQTTETAVYYINHPGIVVKIFDLDCGKADEFGYGPYTRFGLELANFEDIMKIEPLGRFVPTYYGANINHERKFAYIAMEHLPGDDLQTWCDRAAVAEYPLEWVDEFKQCIYEALSIMTEFHKHGIVLVDFKPENIIRLEQRGIKFVDLGAFFTPRHQRVTEKFIYSATPDYSELLIDASNIETGLPLTQASDIFAVGVALFEMATGSSRLEINPATAEEILARPEIYNFRDSQTRDMWRSFPHLKELLPSVETQLKERRILFSELWHLLKAYVAGKVPDWEEIRREEHDQILLATGMTFILEQLPEKLQWLAEAIARSTVLRGIRLKSVTELMTLLENPAPEPAREDILRNNSVVQYLRDMERPTDFIQRLNAWEVRYNPQTAHWCLAAPLVYGHLSESALYTFLKKAHADEQGHRFYQIVGDFEADDFQDSKLTLGPLRDDHYAWMS
jgi:serine/threonine protein kinase